MTLVEEIAQLYFARWSSGCDVEQYDAVYDDGLEFAVQIRNRIKARLDKLTLIGTKNCKGVFGEWSNLDATKRYDVSVLFQMLNQAQLQHTKDEIGKLLE